MEGSRFEQSGALLDEDDVDGSIESGTVDVGNVGHNSVKEVHGCLFTKVPVQGRAGQYRESLIFQSGACQLSVVTTIMFTV